MCRSEVQLYLLGEPRIEYQGTQVRIERRKAMALVSYLALEGQRQSRDVVAALLWPDLDHAHARSALRSTLRSITTPIPLEWIKADRTALGLNPDAVWVDVSAFTGLLAQAGSHGHTSDTVCEECAALYRQAIELYRSDFLAGFHVTDSASYEDWQMMHSAWLRRELGGALRRLAQFEADAGRFEQAVEHARRWLSLDVLHEPAHRLLMQLFAASGQRTEALRQYQQCVDVLQQELASPPEDETIQLFEAIQGSQSSRAPSAELSADLAASILPPLPLLIVGRDEALGVIKQRLGLGGELRSRTVIQGWPGVGKSTIVAMLAHDAEITRQFPDGILWASLGEAPNLLGEITAWAGALRLGEAARARRVEEVSSLITAALHDRRALLIVDDVWQTDHAAPFRVGGQFCALIVTSRLNDVASALAPTADDIYRLPVLSEEASLELLKKLTPEIVAYHPNETRELVRDLEGLPLAIQVAGRLLQAEARLGWGIADLLNELREGANLLAAQPPSDMISAGRDTSPTVAALLKRSTDALDAETRGRFALLGLFVPKPATFDLNAMAAVWNVPDPKPVARRLVDRGLLEPVSGGRFQMHGLLVLHARSLLGAEIGSLP